jgi:lipoprotein-releasing system permease protein
VAMVSLGVSLIATIYPSRSAAKVLPAEALRYE